MKTRFVALIFILIILSFLTMIILPATKGVQEPPSVWIDASDSLEQGSSGTDTTTRISTEHKPQ